MATAGGLENVEKSQRPGPTGVGQRIVFSVFSRPPALTTSVPAHLGGTRSKYCTTESLGVFSLGSRASLVSAVKPAIADSLRARLGRARGGQRECVAARARVEFRVLLEQERALMHHRSWACLPSCFVQTRASPDSFTWPAGTEGRGLASPEDGAIQA